MYLPVRAGIGSARKWPSAAGDRPGSGRFATTYFPLAVGRKRDANLARRGPRATTFHRSSAAPRYPRSATELLRGALHVTPSGTKSVALAPAAFPPALTKRTTTVSSRWARGNVDSGNTAAISSSGSARVVP